LRDEDQRGLSRALRFASERGLRVLPIFIFDSDILGRIEDRDDARVSFLHRQVTQLAENRRGGFWMLKGRPAELWGRILSGQLKADSQVGRVAAVFANEDYEPSAKARDEMVRELCERHGVEFHSFKDQVIFAKAEVQKDDGHPYTVFTPFSRKWRARLAENSIELRPEECRRFESAYSPLRLEPLKLKDLGFIESSLMFPSTRVPTKILTEYAEQRNRPGRVGTSKLGVHLRFGTVSIRQLVAKAIELKAETWLNELIWREFFMQILWRFPRVVGQSFKPAYEQIRWLNDEAFFTAWCEGSTGVPIVDAGMRELNATGFMHNRVRMIAASYLVKHGLVDWRWGEAYFARKLLDFELASNNGNWQWVAGCGCDAAPYFRIFNPDLQTKKFDPQFEYIRTWVPEWQGSSYPKPYLDHALARQRALEAYAVVKLG
jgi:deoxyribodipyrimidine photo-lyase